MLHLIFVLTQSYALPACPIWDCLDLNSTVCARVEYDQVFINEDGCDNNEHCELDGVLKWYQTKKTNGDTSGEYLCEDNDDDTLDIEQDDEKVDCGVRDSGQELSVGFNPKRCENDSDCLLKNGQTAPCMCSFENVKYCQAQWGSGIFDDYWEKCEDDSDYEINTWKYLWYDKQQKWFSYLISTLSCKEHFLELQLQDLYLSEFYFDPDEFAGAIVGVIMFLFI